MKDKKALYQMIAMALFSALTFALTFVNIPFPLGGIVHLGNFACILAALLCGPLVGGVSGSIGMGLFDVVAGYPPSTYLRSFILKFIVAFVAGWIFKKTKETKRTTLLFSISSSVFFIIGVLTLLPIVLNNGSFSFTIDKTYTMTMNILIPIFAFVFSVILFTLIFVARKLNDIAKRAIIATSFAIILNIVLEFILRTILVGLFSGSFAAAFATAIVKIPSSIITGTITILAIAVIYPPLYIATRKNHFIQIINEDKDSVKEENKIEFKK